jgi:mannose-6-phosphate isomerase-like protein (cupin superfamily)
MLRGMTDRDDTATQPKPIFVLPETGKKLHFPGGNIASIMLSGEQTGETLAVAAATEAPDSGPPLHIHRNEDELFIVVEGHYSFFAEQRCVEVGPGGLVYLPKGIPHYYRNIGTTTGRTWIITTPSGWELFLPQYAKELAKPEGPDQNRILEIVQEHGIEFPDEGVGQPR